jgi:hypothetical protein
MRARSIVVVSLCAAALPAGAVGMSMIGLNVHAPAGWVGDQETSKDVLGQWDKDVKIPGLTAQDILTGGGSWVSVGGGGAFHVMWLLTNKAPADVPGLVRRELDATPGSARTEGARADGVEVVSWKEDLGATLASGTMEARNPRAGTRTFARVLMFSDRKGAFHEARIECFVADDADVADARQRCLAALAATEITVPEADRLPIGAVPAAGPTSDAAAPAPTAPGAGRLELDAPRPGASLGPERAGRVEADPPLREPKPPGQERSFSRLMLIGGGLFVIVALALTMGRKRKSE